MIWTNFLINKPMVLLIILLIIGGCQQPSKQLFNEFKIEPNTSNIIQGEKGTILIIPANTFVYEDGTEVKEEITLKLIEAYSLLDMLENGLETRAADGLLVTGGMINLSASSASKQLVKIAKGKSIRWEGINKSSFELFALEGQFWSNPVASSPYLLHIPINKIDSIYCPTFKNTVHFNSAFPDSFKIIANKTYIASIEFLERFKEIFCDEGTASSVLLYFDNIEKPLWVVDSMVINELHNLLIKHPTDSVFFKEKVNKFKQFKAQNKTTLHPSISLNDDDLLFLQNYYKQLKKEIKKDNIISSFDIVKLGWYNLDKYYSQEILQPTKLLVTSNKPLQKVSIIFKDSKILIQGKKNSENQYFFSNDNNPIFKLPHVQAYIIAISNENGNFLFAKKEIIIGKNELEPIDLQKSTIENIQTELENIEKGFTN